MPIDTFNLSWQNILNKPRKERCDIIAQLFQNELIKSNSNFNHLITLKYVKTLLSIQNFNFQCLSLMLKASINYDENPQKTIHKFDKDLNRALHNYINEMPLILKPYIQELVDAIRVECKTGLLSHNYCFMFCHHNWLLKDSSNFVYEHSSNQHWNLIKHSIIKYIHRYFSNHEIKGHIIKSNLPPYVQFELELYYFMNASIELLNQHWLYQFPYENTNELKTIITMYVNQEIIEPEVVDHLKNHFNIH